MKPAPYRVNISPRAFTQLDEIYEWISKDSRASAGRVVAEITKAILSLAELPHRYVVVQTSGDPTKAVYRMPVLSFVVYYRIDDRLNTVNISTVLHGRQGTPKRFPN